MVSMRIGIEGFSFDAAHYTTGITEKCLNIHGHTFRVDVEVEGEISRETGMVIDFELVKVIVKRVLDEWDHSILIPEPDLDKIRIEGPFKVKIKTVNGPAATTEYIALNIAREIGRELNLKVKVRVYEGFRSYAEAVFSNAKIP
ncbi:MAG: 6-carboxytetrahydropterin synthase [Candidatus Methanomethylicia archaeon]